MLVIPKRHVEQIYDLDEGTAGQLGRAVVKVARAVRSAMQVAELNIWQSNGAMAGQEIFHLHVHLFPRAKDDGFFEVYPSDRPFPQVQPRSHLDAIAERIRFHMEP